MTRLANLIALRDAVKEGRFDDAVSIARGLQSVARDRDDFGPLYTLAVEKIMLRKSLDAALAFHEAVLPGWEWERDSGYMIVWIEGVFRQAALDSDHNPARAWLLAILAALIAIEEGKG